MTDSNKQTKEIILKCRQRPLLSSPTPENCYLIAISPSTDPINSSIGSISPSYTVITGNGINTNQVPANTFIFTKSGRYRIDFTISFTVLETSETAENSDSNEIIFNILPFDERGGISTLYSYYGPIVKGNYNFVRTLIGDYNENDSFNTMICFKIDGTDPITIQLEAKTGVAIHELSSFQS